MFVVIIFAVAASHVQNSPGKLGTQVTLPGKFLHYDLPGRVTWEKMSNYYLVGLLLIFKNLPGEKSQVTPPGKTLHCIFDCELLFTCGNYLMQITWR